MRLYEVVIGHHRYREPPRSFRHRLHTWLVDLDALPALPRFRARDHLGDPDRSIRANLEHWLGLHGVDLRGGQVLMLAHPRTLGHVFNPLTVYWCHRSDGGLECVVAEVHNTHGERHCYLLRPNPTGSSEVDKAFYVSPFLPGRGRYRMRLEPPGQRISLRIDLEQDGVRLFTATMTGRRRPITPVRLLRTALVPHRVSALIRGHGIVLWLRRTPIFPRRPHVHQEGVR